MSGFQIGDTVETVGQSDPRDRGKGVIVDRRPGWEGSSLMYWAVRLGPDREVLLDDTEIRKIAPDKKPARRRGPSGSRHTRRSASSASARTERDVNVRELHFAGYTFDAGPLGTKIRREAIDYTRPGDYGADPLGDGRFRMVPSGDVVDFAECNRRLQGR